MTTIVNTPPSGENSGSGMGMVFGVIIAIVLIALFFIYALPAMRTNTVPQSGDNGDIDVNVKLPTDLPDINVQPVAPTP